MRKNVLVVSSISLYRNSSVCLANAAYLEGFVENGYDVTIVMPSCDEADKDPAMILPKEVRYLVYNRTSPIEQKIAKSVKTTELNVNSSDSFFKRIKRVLRKKLSQIKQGIIKAGKKNTFFVNDKYFIGQAVDSIQEIGDREYYYVISLSSPVSSHYVAEQLLLTNKINYNKWIQVWQDPWYYDLYTKKDSHIFDEELRLLKIADKIVYVSPLTYEYQKKIFEECSDKMMWSFLPCYKSVRYPEKTNKGDSIKIGYFGEFVSSVRRIEPLAIAIDRCQGVDLIVCGNGDVDLDKYRNIQSYGRVDISKVEELQGECDILVNISNIKGGQIPGKVYQYAGTSKAILFLLDGTEDEMKTLQDIFEKYNRFVFCKNDEKKIEDCLNKLDMNNLQTKNEPVMDFFGKSVVKKIIDNC